MKNSTELDKLRSELSAEFNKPKAKNVKEYGGEARSPKRIKELQNEISILKAQRKR